MKFIFYCIQFNKQFVEETLLLIDDVYILYFFHHNKF